MTDYYVCNKFVWTELTKEKWKQTALFYRFTMSSKLLKRVWNVLGLGLCWLGWRFLSVAWSTGVQLVFFFIDPEFK